LNCTIPALANIKVGSFCGTSGEEGTISCPFFWKKPRKADRISLTLVIPSFRYLKPDRAAQGFSARVGRALWPDKMASVKPCSGTAEKSGGPVFSGWGVARWFTRQ
jgi:hypothetical protein